jgi:alkanesulfonate monooxygenase SsuD/methylene tetrahydromethanopterin reductase-like flavin-dependent oxidoreductase (luciferase family)
MHVGLGLSTGMRRIWAGQPYGDAFGPIGPVPVRSGGPEVLFGACRPAAIERIARFGDGYLGATPLDCARTLFRAVEQAWQAPGRTGRPRLVAQAAPPSGRIPIVQEACEECGAYYGSGEYTAQVLDGVVTTPQRIREAIAAFADLGADEMVLYCWSRDVDQVNRLADVVA